MTGRRVLVVDDETGFRDMLRWNLRVDDVPVDAAEDGDEALRYLMKGDYALVLSDITMPRHDGLRLLKTIREKWPGLPVILMTGFGTVETAVEAMKLGARDFVLKPFDLELMVARVRDILGLTKMGGNG